MKQKRSKKSINYIRNALRATSHRGQKWDGPIKTMEEALLEKEANQKREEEQEQNQQTMKNLYCLEKPVVMDTPKGKRVVAAKKFEPPGKVQTDITNLMDSIRIVTEYFANTENETKELTRLLEDCRCESIDLLHAIELGEPKSDKDKIDIYEKIKDMRIRRRSYKRRLSYFEEIALAIRKSPTMTTTLETLLRKLELIKEKEENAVYAPRIRTDIEENKNIKYMTPERIEQFKENK